MSVKINKTTLVIIIMLAIIACFFIWLNLSRTDSTAIISENGVCDLRDLSFENVTYSLSGQVEYIPGVLLTPEEFEAREREAVIGFPQNVSQYATSRLYILLPDDSYYTFSCRSIDYSERLYINGEWILDIGSPGNSKETTIHNTGKISLTLKPVGGIIEIVQQSANFVHREGGGHAAWDVSVPELRASHFLDFQESIKLGCFLALFFVHIILFILLRTYRANLYFALFCLMWFLRTGVTGTKIFTGIFPWMSWTVKFRIEYLAFPVTAILLVSLLDALFSGILNKWFMYALNGVSAVIAALFLFADTLFMSYALLWCEAIYIPAIIYIVIRFVMKLRTVSPEQIVFLAGVGMFFYASVHDMLYYNGIFFFHIGDISSISMLLLTFCEAAAVFIATVREVERAKEQEWVLAVENATLRENAHMAEQQLILQGEQYKLLIDNAVNERAMRHDFRHHLSVIKTLADSSKANELNQYLSDYFGSLPLDNTDAYCQNSAVNAVVCYYINKTAGVDVSVDIDIPKDINISDTDLCVIFGNCLENAVEACQKLPDDEGFIKVKTLRNGRTLGITVDNSFDGEYTRENDVFISHKHTGAGIGLSSVAAAAKKYNGTAMFEVVGREFRSSVMLVVPMDDGQE